jgi:CRISPR/Cas system-associated exonuclease Cas4 (RecB family)
MLSEEEKEHYGDVPGDCLKIVKGYLAHYKEEDKGLQFRQVEKEFGPFELTPGIMFTAKPDAIVEDTMGKMWLLEMKTGKRLPNEDFRIWNLQTLLYIWALHRAGIIVQGVIWDHIRTKIPTEPKLLKEGGMSRRELDTTYDVYHAALVRNKLNPDEYREVLEALKHRADFYVRYKLPVKETMLNHIVHDAKITAEELKLGKITRDISQMKCPRCMYRPLCEAALLDGDEEFVKQREFVPKHKKEEVRETEDERET